MGTIASKITSLTIVYSLCLYERQSVKPARLIGCPGSFERKYCVLCAGKVLWKNYEPFLRSFPVATFLWTPVCQASAANWLPRLIWKEILCTLCRESIMKNYEPFLRSFPVATFLWTPVCQTSAANWLPRLIWKEILCTLCRKSILKQFCAGFWEI